MKKLVLSFLSILSLNSIAQTYYSFPTDYAVWSVEEYFYAGFPFPDECITRHYGISGDTIIQNYTYSKLYGNNLPGDFPYSDTAFNLSTSTYVAAVREDTSKKVWIRLPNDTTDILYYDFSLQLGDTFCFDYFNVGCFQVFHIDSILIDGNYRRQIYFSVPNSETWIEGIGSATGWFEWQYTSSWSWHLLCYKENQNQLYGSTFCHCDTYTSIYNFSSDNDEIRIYPNPISEIININFTNRSISTINTEITDVLGQVIKIIPATKYLQGENKIAIPVSHLPAGIYFLKLYVDDSLVTKKFLKN